MTTAQDLCLRAMKTCGAIGAGQTASTNDLQDMLDLLNEMLLEWSAKRWFMFQLLDVAFIGTGAASYTVGPGLQFNTPTPDRIEDAYMRLLNGQTTPVDFPLEIMQAREDWDRIGLKSLSSFPCAVYYDASFPTGTLYVWPNPTSAYEIHIIVKAQLPQFVYPTDPVFLPAPYANAIRWNLAAHAASLFGLPPRPDIIGLAKAALNTLRRANTKVPRMQAPDGLVRRNMGGAGGPWWAGVAGAPSQLFPVLDTSGQPVLDSNGMQIFSPTPG